MLFRFAPPTTRAWPYYTKDKAPNDIIKNLEDVNRRWEALDTLLCQCPGLQIIFEGRFQMLKVVSARSRLDCQIEKLAPSSDPS